VDGGPQIDPSQLNSFATKDSLVNLESRLAACEKSNIMQDQVLESHEDRIAALERNFERMGVETSSQIQQLSEMLNSMGNMPSSGGDTSGIDMGQFQMVISKIQSELKYKANQSDFESLREALNHKADKSTIKKDIDRLDTLVEQLR
jgi:uncharacterized coiled-coil protein SlyX